MKAWVIAFHEVKTSTDGSFYFPPLLEATCGRVRLSADKREDLWLKTGHDIFDGVDNGTAPIVESPRAGSPATTEIMLGNRGSLVSFRVWDVATGRFIWARLYLERMPVPGVKFGSTLLATARDGSADTLFLPAGQYLVFVESYSCGQIDYTAAERPQETFTVESGQRIAQDISVDVRLIKPMKWGNNPHGRPCKL